MVFQYASFFNRRGRFFYLYIVVGFCLFLIVLHNIEISKPIGLYKTYDKVLKPKNQLHCHFLTTYETLPDLQDTFVENDKSIFFLETTCSSYLNGNIVIRPRQACAVESAALMNPNRTVYLLFSSPGKLYDDKTQSYRLIKNLLSYQNVKVMHLNTARFIKGTLVENLWTSGKLLQSKYIVTHTSDLLRLLALWKYGGIYLDLDVVVIKTLENLPPNFAGAEDNENIGSSVMGFSKFGLGHQHLNTCLYDVSMHFDGSQWGFNGPLALTRMACTLCNTHNILNMVNKSCQDFYVMPPDAFFAIHWNTWRAFFDKSKNDFVKKKTNNSYVIHLWNKLSSDAKIPLHKNVPYLDLAKTYCPRTVQSFENKFKK